MIVVISTSIGLYVTWMWISNFVLDDIYHTVSEAHSSPLFYLNVVLTVGACSMIDFSIKSFSFLMKPSPSEFLRGLLKTGKVEENLDLFYEIC